MATLTAWKFDRPDGASLAMRTLRDLNNEGLIDIQEAAIVEWPVGQKKPKTRQLNDLTGRYALGGLFWGFLFGILFFVPVIGAGVGAAAGAIWGKMEDVGVDDDFIANVKEKVTEGTSALFLLSSGAVADRIRQRFAGTHLELIESNLSAEDEAALRDRLGLNCATSAPSTGGITPCCGRPGGAGRPAPLRRGPSRARAAGAARRPAPH